MMNMLRSDSVDSIIHRSEHNDIKYGMHSEHSQDLELRVNEEDISHQDTHSKGE